MNSIIISGRLTRQPTLSESTNGTKYSKFVVAVKKMKDETDFFTCVAWKEQAETICKYVNKGDQIIINGSMNCRVVESEGKKQYYWELNVNRSEFVTKKEETDTQEQNLGSKDTNFSPIDEDDNLPF